MNFYFMYTINHFSKKLVRKEYKGIKSGNKLSERRRTMSEEIETTAGNEKITSTADNS